MPEAEDRLRRIAQRLKTLLEEDSGCEFEWGLQTLTEAGMGRVYDEEKLPAMLRSWDLYDHYEHSEIDWDKDWTDNNPIYIDSVGVYDDHVVVYLRREFSFNFLVYKHYHLRMVQPGIMFSSRENRMKASRFIPAAVKDLEVFLRILNDSLKKYNIDSSELVWDDLKRPGPIHFGLQLSFKTSDMNEDDVVEATMRRCKALAEYRRNFRAWLSSEERKRCYESTHRPRMRAWWSRHLCAWPLGIPELEEEYRKDLVGMMRWELGHYLEALKEYEQGQMRRRPDLSEYFRFYNLDGYALRFSGRPYLDEGTKGKPLADLVKFEGGGEVVVDRRTRLRPFPPERMEFLKGEFPELFA